MNNHSGNTARIDIAPGHNMREEDRIDLAIELILGIEEPQVHHRVSAAADIIDRHSKKLARDHLKLQHSIK